MNEHASAKGHGSTKDRNSGLDQAIGTPGIDITERKDLNKLLELVKYNFDPDKILYNNKNMTKSFHLRDLKSKAYRPEQETPRTSERVNRATFKNIFKVHDRSLPASTRHVT